MTTKEFIKMLQDADPSGNAHVRMSGGIPIWAEHKEGYWDGPYSYIDEDGKWVYSTKGSKVDICTYEIDDFVFEKVSTHNIPTWEDVASKFKFELSYSNKEQRDEKEIHILEEAREAYDSAVAMHKKFENDGIARAIERSNKGWKWFQNKLVDDKTIKPNLHHFYTWFVLDENGKEEWSNLHNVEAVYKSGLFERLDNSIKPGYYQWVYNQSK